ncbi:MAG: radical SAM protein [Candidatus Cryptobacteroides sp.]
MYSPLRGIAFMVDSNTAANLMSGSSNNRLVEDISQKLSPINYGLLQSVDISISEISQNLVILLSNSCNLGCKYCYAQYEREHGFLSEKKIENIINFIFELNKNNPNIVSVSFLGGGEPTFNWELLVWTIEYAKQKADSYGIKLRIGFPTNATLLTAEKIDFLVKNNIEVGISFELISDIQDEQRPFANSNQSTYNVVKRNVHLLNQKGIQTRFRSTITPQYVHRMPEMVKNVAEEFPFIKKIHFEPVYPLLESEVNLFDIELFYGQFIDNFMSARYIGDSYNINITTAVTNTLGKIKPRYCRGELCITPKGDIVICHRSSSEKDVRYNKFRYGTVSDEYVSIDNAKFQKVSKLLNKKAVQCKECFSKWHCSGMCLSNREMYSETQFQAYCSFVKKLQARYVEYMLQKGGVINESNRFLCE